ncbi:MAG: cobaltochelatase subunit CobN [Desulfamplus sp.]|nr:cobaltochelatase subunit CobN [Desulfamplus sp.]
MKSCMCYFIVALMITSIAEISLAADSKKIGFFVGDVDAYTCFQALEKASEFKEIKDSLEIRIFTDESINPNSSGSSDRTGNVNKTRSNNPEYSNNISHDDISHFVSLMDVAVVDIMPPNPAQWLLNNRSLIKPDAKIYAVRSSSHNQDFLDAGFIMDNVVRNYFSFTSSENLSNLIRFLASRDLGIESQVKIPPPIVPPENALYHPDAPKLFSDLDEYVKWYKESGHFKEYVQVGNNDRCSLHNPVQNRCYLHQPVQNSNQEGVLNSNQRNVQESIKQKEEGRGLWNLSIIFPTYAIDGKNAPLDALIHAYEQQGINTITWFREMKDRDKNLSSLLSKEPLASSLGSITGFDFKFSSTLTPGLAEILKQVNVPVFNAQYLFFNTKDEWLSSPQGVSAADITMQFSTPEISGLVEPTVVGVKEKIPPVNILKNRQTKFDNEPQSKSNIKPQDSNTYIYTPVTQNIEKLAKRAAKWHALKKKSNKDKKVVLVYYNHGAGKQNIGASYLNVFRSIDTIIKNLKQAGYTINEESTNGNMIDKKLNEIENSKNSNRDKNSNRERELTEEKIKDLLLKSGRNIGSWAPGELDELIAQGNAAFIDMQDYKDWLSKTPQEFQAAVEKDWGKPEDSKVMVKDGRFVIPCVRLGNLMLVPQPVRGWSDDPDKLYHSTVLQPHHQYAAFYLWLQNQIKPDAMISLGTHGTHEWLPGKEAGLTWKCPPEVLIGDIPSLYPYIVDDVGEGIQAKRRGRGVVIDHAVPPFKEGGAYGEYSQLAALISEYESSGSDKIRSSKLERIGEMVVNLGLDKDLEFSDKRVAEKKNTDKNHVSSETAKTKYSIKEDDLEKIEHYLLTLKTQMVPYGLHTFGVSPSGEGLIETANAIADRNGVVQSSDVMQKKILFPLDIKKEGQHTGDKQEDKTAQFYKQQLSACGPSEMESLINGLSGGYVPSASGNDPIRNPESLPTGKNFYGFDPEKTPSKEAWENGKKAGLEIIESYQKKHDGKYPEQVGVILWSVETIRDEGINVATALYLMGMQPVWDHRDKIKNFVPIAGAELNRPRIDVLLQMSGLFRDTFPTVALLLDKAVKQASALTDVENFLRKHSLALEESLLKEGHTKEDAKKLSLVRLFSAPPGAYGTKVDDMAGASGLWEKDDIVAEQGFVQMQSFGYSSDMWGEKATPVYRQHLKKVDATVHTISSNLYGTMDNDDMFQYLGGLSMAVRKASGKEPDVFVSMQRDKGNGHIESIGTTLGKELRSRYLNPKWIEGMKKESYAGARDMAEFMENMWGWQVTTPEAVDSKKWEQTYEVYVEDKYGLDIKEFFNKENPWAYQSMTARMLEAVRKEYWNADDKITKKLAAEYALNIVEKGVACCDHTCNNPVLNQMVVNIISIPGVLSPEIVEKFKIAIEQATGAAIDKQVIDRKELLEKLSKTVVKPDLIPELEKIPQSDNSSESKKNNDPSKSAQKSENAPEIVEGYKMEEIKSEDKKSQVATSGVQWFASFFVLTLIALFVIGTQTNKIYRKERLS